MESKKGYSKEDQDKTKNWSTQKKKQIKKYCILKCVKPTTKIKERMWWNSSIQQYNQP